MHKYLTPLARKIEPYVPGEQPRDRKYIKLNTNENPYPPSDKVRAAVFEEISNLRLYPDPDSLKLVSAIASYYGVKNENVFVGNGSDEVLALAFPAFFSGRTVLFPDITYSFYPVYSRLFGARFREIPLSEDFSIVPEAYYCANGGIIIPNPNAPTGKCISLNDIKKIVQNNNNMGGIVLVDEAYIDFGGESAVGLIDKYPNLLVVQTLSKSRALAGLRIGYAIGNRVLIDALNRIKNSFNSYTLDRLAMAGAAAAIEDRDYFSDICNRIVRTREWVAEELKLLGFEMPESKANFLFMRHKKKGAEEIFEKLKEKGILVRHFNKPRINNYLRVSIGTDDEMKLFIDALKEIVSDK